MSTEPHSFISVKFLAGKAIIFIHSAPGLIFYMPSCFVLLICSGGGGNFVLSTSLVGYTRIAGAIVPMVKHGYGIVYRIRDDR